IVVVPEPPAPDRPNDATKPGSPVVAVVLALLLLATGALAGWLHLQVEELQERLTEVERKGQGDAAALAALKERKDEGAGKAPEQAAVEKARALAEKKQQEDAQALAALKEELAESQRRRK